MSCTFWLKKKVPRSVGDCFDMIEREMEGGVVIIQPPEVHEDYSENRLGGLVSIEEHVDVREIDTTRAGVPKV